MRNFYFTRENILWSILPFDEEPKHAFLLVKETKLFIIN